MKASTSFANTAASYEPMTRLTSFSMSLTSALPTSARWRGWTSAFARTKRATKRRSLPNSAPSLIEFLVDGKAVAVGKSVRLVRHSHDGHQLPEHGVRHAGLAGEGGMARDAVAATIGDADSEVDQLFGETIQRARRKHRLLGLPGSLQQSGIAGKVLPEVVHVGDLPRRFDVVEDGTNFC